MAKIVESIRPGDRVTIVDRFGKQRTGRAVMRGSHGGWVLNMGGKHGTPGIASDENITRVQPTKRPGPKGGIGDSRMAKRRRTLRGTKFTDRGKCEITGHASMRDVKECATQCNSHWFDKDTMRFFKSRVGTEAFADGKGGAFFASTEKGPHGPRAASVRHFDGQRCAIDTVGEFMGYKTKAAAEKKAKALAAGGGLSGRRRRRRR